MSAKGLKSLFRTGDDITGSEIDAKTKTIMFQTGDAQSESSHSEAESWQHVGFASRPSPVSKTGNNAAAAQGIVINQSGYDVVIATRDVRYQDIYGSLKAGETAIYATGATGTAQGRILLKEDGSINLYTKKDNKDSGIGMGIFVSGTADSISAMNSSGTALVLDSGAKLFTSKGGLVIGDSVKLSSTGKVNISGTSIVLGGASALPVLTTKDLSGIIAAINAGFAALIGVATGQPAGATAVAAFTGAMSAVTAAALLKRTSAE